MTGPDVAAARYAALALAARDAAALLGMYEASRDPAYVDEARAVLEAVCEPVRRPRVPSGQRDADDVRRQRRDTRERRRQKDALAVIESGPDLYDDLPTVEDS